MADVLTPLQRSFNMSQIKGKDTKPEFAVRSILHRLGYRYRLHVAYLPGKPDIVLPKHGTIIEVRGCFWHKHTCKSGRVTPMTNEKFWKIKRDGTVVRDAKNKKQLSNLGWRVLVIWECWCKDKENLTRRLVNFLESS